MSLNPEDEAKLSSVYNDFLEKVEKIELERDSSILSILKDSVKNNKD